MLLEVRVQNLAVLAGAEVEFGRGFNVLTGETGAGKSILVDCLALLAGARASSDQIRTGAPSLTVTGVFRPGGRAWQRVLEEAGLDANGAELMVRREVQREGRNRVFLNDQPATLRLLADLGPMLLRIHGQREELGLVTPDLQRFWLDRSGGDRAVEPVRRVAAAHRRYADLAARLLRSGSDERLRSERLELVRFQIAELDAARLEAGEDARLRAEREVLRNVEAITAALGAARGALRDDEGSVEELLGVARRRLEEVGRWEGAVARWTAEVEQARAELGEVASDISRRLEGLEPDPGRLDAVETRLAALDRLTRKHGRDASGLIELRRALGAEREELESAAISTEELESAAAAALAEFRSAAEELSRLRAGWGEALAARVMAELSDLALPRARFAVSLERRARAASPLDGLDFGAHGLDQVVFLFSPNPGEELRPLARAASGGELSRVDLALQLAAGLAEPGAHGEGEAQPVLVFDEIDAGVGGAEGHALGQKLRRLARAGQVLAVTHLAQVASQGDAHFRVGKAVRGDRTFASVERLDAEGRIDEIARMLSGARTTELSRAHARELLTGPGGAATRSPNRRVAR
jgi:DNA repair protein RecN (Recombination protein N)